MRERERESHTHTQGVFLRFPAICQLRFDANDRSRREMRRSTYLIHPFVAYDCICIFFLAFALSTNVAVFVTMVLYRTHIWMYWTRNGTR